MAAFSRSAIDKLGERLRAEGSASAELLDSLQKWRAEHDDPRARVHGQLKALDFGTPVLVTSRLKTVSTIVGKLKVQQQMRLSQMGDVAGVRVVISEGSRLTQDRIVYVVRALFPGAKTKDRRANPSQQYRAVHVEVKSGGHDVEVQIRTPLQHLWAELVEKLGDSWGRQIRYGGPPNDPERLVVAGSTREDVLTELFEISETIHQAEMRQGFAEEVADLISRLGAKFPEELLSSIRTALTAMQAQSVEELQNARDMLRALGEVNVDGEVT